MSLAALGDDDRKKTFYGADIRVAHLTSPLPTPLKLHPLLWLTALTFQMAGCQDALSLSIDIAVPYLCKAWIQHERISKWEQHGFVAPHEPMQPVRYDLEHRVEILYNLIAQLQ